MKHIVDTLEVESGWMALKGHDPNRRMVKATLVIGDERVFTESEVRAMAADMIAVAVSEANTVYPSEQHAEKGVIHAMRETIERHGVSIDPA